MWIEKFGFFEDQFGKATFNAILMVSWHSFSSYAHDYLFILRNKIEIKCLAAKVEGWPSNKPRSMKKAFFYISTALSQWWIYL